jgi:hypothetical protein
MPQGQVTASAMAENIRRLERKDLSLSGIVPGNAISDVSIATAAPAIKTPLKF